MSKSIQAQLGLQALSAKAKKKTIGGAKALKVGLNLNALVKNKSNGKQDKAASALGLAGKTAAKHREVIDNFNRVKSPVNAPKDDKVEIRIIVEGGKVTTG